MNKKKIFLLFFAITIVLFLMFILLKYALKENSDDNLRNDQNEENQNSPSVYKIGDHIVGKPDIVTKEDCEKMENEAEKEDCEDRIKLGSILNESKNLKDCLGLSTMTYRNNCLYRLAENYKDPRLCKKISNHSYRESCISGVAINLKDKNICNEFKEEPYEKQECEDRVDAFLVVDKKIFLGENREIIAVEIDECAKIKTLEYSKLCVGNVLRESIILIGNTDNKIFEDNYSDFYYYRTSAVLEDCKKIVLEGARSACINKINKPDFTNYDYDLDGLSDEKELWFSTDPGKKDTDNDGLTDYEEILSYHINPTNPDTDNDGLTDYEEIEIYKTHPNKPDTDGDGIIDGEEVQKRTDTHSGDTDKDGLLDLEEIKYGTDINNSDTDGDDVSDFEEIREGYDPLKNGLILSDTDNDGLLDINEIFYGTDRLNSDSDSDGISDKIEVDNLTNPLGEGDMDFDGDGLSDKEEKKLGTNPSMADEDDDGLSDYDEIIIYKTNPKRRDTDFDGFSDGEEIRKGYNPLRKD